MKITVQRNEADSTTEIAIVNETSNETVRSATVEDGQVGCVWLGASTSVPEIAIEAGDGETPEPEGGEPAADPRGGDGAVETAAAGDAGDAGASTETGGEPGDAGGAGSSDPGAATGSGASGTAGATDPGTGAAGDAAAGQGSGGDAGAQS